MNRKIIYVALLLFILLPVAGWQAMEHLRVRESLRKDMAGRARDLSAALSVVIRSQGRVAFIPKLRLEAALDELIASTELESVMLLNATGEVVAQAGKPMALEPATLLRTHELWMPTAASFANLVALGPGTEGTEGGAAILPVDMPRGGGGPEGRQNPAMAATPEELLRNPFFSQLLDDRKRTALLEMTDGAPLTPEQVDTILGLFQGGAAITEHRAETMRRTLAGRPLDLALLEETLMMAMAPPNPSGPRPERPPWMSGEEYDRLVEERGVHWFLVTIPTNVLRAETSADLRLRFVVLSVALLACAAAGFAGRAMERSALLRVQLVQARATAERLTELNVTAAGLVHETKNPLNIIRGLAQMIGREDGITDEMRGTAVKITEEADRVAGRLNQFLAYARPVNPSIKRIELNALLRDVFGVLAFDLEEKAVVIDLDAPEVVVLADEDMLRQSLFNLLLNAVQAAPNGGRVEVAVTLERGGTVRLEVRDNGPGVPEENRAEVFRPYFTTSKNGTGLGLAVVRQYALLHNWTVECLPAREGALFRLGNITLTRGNGGEMSHG